MDKGSESGTPFVPPATSCYVDDWEVFSPGYWKQQYFSPDDCRRMVDNFQRLSVGSEAPYPTRGKLGHDNEQRLALSLGFPAVGLPTRMWLKPNGRVAMRVDNVPLAVGQEINADRINGGSVEIKPEIPDPADPAKMIRGPVFAAISFLGEEEPGVKWLKPPKARLYDGSEVGPGQTPELWLKKLAAVARDSADSLTLSFSDYREAKSMSRDEIIAKLTAIMGDLTPEILAKADDQLTALLSQVSSQGFSDAMKKKFAAPPPPADPKVTLADATPPVVDSTPADPAAMAATLADHTTRIAALESAMSDMKANTGTMSAMSAAFRAEKLESKKSRVNDMLGSAVAEGRLPPALRPQWTADLVAADDTPTSKFSDGANAGETPYATLVKQLKSRAVDSRFSAIPNGDPSDGGDVPEWQRAAMMSSPRGRSILNGQKK